MDQHISAKRISLAVIKYFFIILTVVILILLMVEEKIDYFLKKPFLVSNPIALIIACLAVAVIIFIWGRLGSKVRSFISTNMPKYIPIFILVVFFFQIFISYHVFFQSGWDVGAILSFIDLKILDVPWSDWYDWYFSAYQNNLMITWIFYRLTLLGSKISIGGLMSIIILNCLVSSVTGWLVYRSTRILLSESWAIFSWLIYVVFIGFNPWMTITYTDQLALCFPILIFYLYLISKDRRLRIPIWFLISLVVVIGYSIKPTIIIMLTAILIIETLRFLVERKKIKKEGLLIMLAILTTFFITKTINSYLVNDLGFTFNNEAEFGWPHWLMVGLNESTDGRYAGEDVIYAKGFLTRDARNAAIFRVIKDRLENFGFTGYLQFAARKALVNFGDGTFAWAKEGNFYNKEMYPRVNEKVASFLRSFYYDYGSNYPITSMIQQAIWVGIITSMIGIYLIENSKIDFPLAVLMLSLIGLIIFVMIFEARARYLYSYSPIFIMAGIIGLSQIKQRLSKLNCAIRIHR